MQFLELFLVLVAGHFLADYVFQTDAIATGKNRNLDPAKFGVNWYYWMTAHAVTHSVPVYLLTGSVWWALFEFTTHWLIDWGKCENLYKLHVDQFFHMLSKYIIVVFVTMP